MSAPAQPRPAGTILGSIGKKPAIMPEDPGTKLGPVSDKRQKMVHGIGRKPPPR